MVQFLKGKFFCFRLHFMVVGYYINKMKTTFDFNLDLYQAFKQHETQKHTNKEKLSIKKLLFNNL